ncbi:MAG: aldo/keto reductase [Clostridia bacterium]|nr:aldo/keto reductase [Clostridia bacterium]
MKYTKLGRSDLVVSRICLGCMGFGDPQLGHHSWTLDYEHSAEVIQAALDAGINFFDTAIGYQGGTSEQYVGRALRESGKLADCVVATKFLPRTPEEIAEGVSGKEHIHRSLDQSLEHLGMDHVDLYIYHMWDYNTPIMDVLEAMNDTVREGKVRYLGISNCYAWQLAMANEMAKAAGLQGFISVQNHFNLLFREEEREMMALCHTQDIAMTPYSALAAGRLSREPGSVTTKRLEEDKVAKSKYDATEKEDDIIIERVHEVAKQLGVSMSDVAIAWLLTKVTAPVVGSTKVPQIQNAAKAVDLELTPEQISYLEEPYVPHRLVGVMDFNRPRTDQGRHVWPVTK